MSAQSSFFPDDRFDTPATRYGDPDTSHAAAEDVALNAGTLRYRVLVQLAHIGDNGYTDFELADRLHGYKPSVGKRRTELLQAGYCHDTGRRRPSPTGSQAAVWAITPAGYIALNWVTS